MRLFLATGALAALAFFGLYFEYGNEKPVYAQSNPSSTAPDCQFSTTITGVAASAAIPNSSATAGTPCVFWRLTYTPNGFTALTLAFQGARDVSGAAGAFTNIPAGNILEGTNPLTDFTCAPGAAGCTLVARIYTPWVRVNVSAVTGVGSIQVRAFGYRGTNPAATAAAAAASNVNINQVAGVATASDGAGGQVPGGISTVLGDTVANTQTVFEADNAGTPTIGANRNFAMKFNGSTWDRDFTCPSQIETALSGTAYTTIVAASGSTVLRICKVFVTSSSGGNPVVNTFTLAFGTCAGAPTEAMNAAGITGLDSDFGGSLRSAASGAFCVKESVANSDKVTVTYAQY